MTKVLSKIAIKKAEANSPMVDRTERTGDLRSKRGSAGYWLGGGAGAGAGAEGWAGGTGAGRGAEVFLGGIISMSETHYIGL
jgi:hypothetical protein